MSLLRKKTEKCLNCGYDFQEEVNNFCPSCGQENDDKLKSIRELLKEFFLNLVTYDTKMYRSLFPFIFRPGKLTNAYNCGQRMKYILPMRLYLVTSVIYFFVFSMVVISQNEKGLVDFEFSDKDKKEKPKKPEASIKNDSLPNKFKSQPVAAKNDNTKAKNKKQKLKVQNTVFGINSHIIVDLAKRNKGISEDAILDSIRIERNFLNRLAVRQTIRLNNASLTEIIKFFWDKVPLTMFFLIPIFALVLKILYIRRKKYFLEHFIFVLHTHSFYFFLLTLVTLGTFMLNYTDNNLIPGTFLILGSYTYASFYNVYKQNFFKTLVKMFFYNFFYWSIITVGLVLAILISLLIF